jgi:hypothetical protein|tara:strand:+ start:146 stop:649 length:504 start_codon:yes stop_codon:yes gene_type:complete
MQLNKFILFLLICTLFSCEKEYISNDVEPNVNSGIINNDNFPYPCLDGECNTSFEIDTLVSPGAYLDDNGYWHVEFNGLFYFTVMGQLDELDPAYIINEVPLISSEYYYNLGDGYTNIAMYTNTPRQQFTIFEDIVGDTLKIDIKTRFNIDMGQRVEIFDEINIIIE